MSAVLYEEGHEFAAWMPLDETASQAESDVCEPESVLLPLEVE
jgi:hypothetical protein